MTFWIFGDRSDGSKGDQVTLADGRIGRIVGVNPVGWPVVEIAQGLLVEAHPQRDISGRVR